MRLALLGAFPFPYPQGSQTFAAAQLSALREAGADACLLTYGRGKGAADLGLAWRGSPFSPRRLRSGLSPAKPLADAALLATLLREQRRLPFDAVLAHNAEAALVALAARRLTKVPVVYVAHTLWRHELASYLPARFASGAASDAADLAGAALDRTLARRSDAVISLCEAAHETLAEFTRAPAECIAPGHAPAPAPSSEAQRARCLELGLEPGTFALYCGNLDAYQDLERLSDAGKQLELPLVLATHDSRGGGSLAGLRVVELEEHSEMRELAFAAGALLLPRRRPGGFPIKLLNYLETGRPIVADARVVEGLTHEVDAWLLGEQADGVEWASAIATLLKDRERAERLGRAGRVHLDKKHAWPELAARTLELVARARDGRAG